MYSNYVLKRFERNGDGFYDGASTILDWVNRYQDLMGLRENVLVLVSSGDLSPYIPFN